MRGISPHIFWEILYDSATISQKQNYKMCMVNCAEDSLLDFGYVVVMVLMMSSFTGLAL